MYLLLFIDLYSLANRRWRPQAVRTNLDVSRGSLKGLSLKTRQSHSFPFHGKWMKGEVE